MVTIVLLVSRSDYLERVITSLELLDCRAEETNLLAIVDGDDRLFLRVRNLVNGCKFNGRLTVKSNLRGEPPRYDIQSRRQRIAAIHNQARGLITHEGGYIFAVEDDTTFGTKTLNRLLKVADTNRAFGLAVGVELGRWGVPYVGAWNADDIYDPSLLTSVENVTPVPAGYPPTRIDAGGLFCTLIRADLYKSEIFHCENGLGPDINFGLDIRRLGHENFLVWQAQCIHYNNVLGEEIQLTPDQESKILKLIKTKGTKWGTSY